MDVNDPIRLVAVVDAEGRVREVPALVNVTGLVNASGELEPWAVARGCELLSRLYEREKDTEGAKAWADFVAARDSGRKVEPFDPSMLPAEVRRRRETPKAEPYVSPTRDVSKPKAKGKR